jgi:flagellar motor switch protein FliN/FliY
MLTIHGHPVFRAKLKDGHIKILEFPLYHEVETPMAKQEDEDDFSDFDDLIEDDTELEDQTLTDTSFDEAKETETSSQKEAQTLPKPQKESLIPLDQIPVSIVVEVGRIQMPLQKALELEPGNLLELDLHPEDGVDLVVNGKKMGRAELIRIGDAIGVRILEIGRSST